MDEVPDRDRNTKPWFVLIKEYSESPVQKPPHSQLFQLHHSVCLSLSLALPLPLHIFVRHECKGDLCSGEMVNDGLGRAGKNGQYAQCICVKLSKNGFHKNSAMTK